MGCLSKSVWQVLFFLCVSGGIFFSSLLPLPQSRDSFGWSTPVREVDNLRTCGGGETAAAVSVCCRGYIHQRMRGICTTD